MDNKNEIMNMMLEMEYVPSIKEESINLNTYNKLPISDIATLGSMFAGFSTNARTITSILNVEGVYRATLPEGATHLASFKNGTGMLGAALDSSNHLVGQAILNPAEGITQTAVMSVDPMTLAMAAMLMSIEAKLDDIKETQQEIYNFLKQKEKSRLKANLDFLSNIVNNYKYSFDNAMYIKGHYNQVLQINKESKESIDLYENLIKSEMNKQKFIHTDIEIKQQKNKLIDYFKDYQLSLYTYSFSDFVEVILSKNFNSDYLNNKVFEINQYSHKYKHLYTNCYNMLEKYTKTSIESQVLKGLSSASKASGEFLSKVPLISKSLLDESLVDAGKMLKKVEHDKNNKALNTLVDVNDSGVLLFVNNIETINDIYNKPMDILLDHDYLYIKSSL